MGSFARAKHSPVTFGMALRSLTLNILSAAIWEFVRVLLQVYATEVCFVHVCSHAWHT